MSHKTIQHVFYNNPDQYPPIVNSLRLLAAAGYESHITSRFDGQNWQVSYPSKVTLQRLDTRGGNVWQEYLRFVVQTYKSLPDDALFYVGHDMHGFLPAWLLSRRYRRPLLYHCHDFAEGANGLGMGGRLVKLFEQLFARTADWVIVPDAERAALVVHALRLRRLPLVVANAPLRPFPADGRLQAELARRGKQFERILLRQGRIGPGHALETTLRSLPAWQNPAWGLVVMGVGEAAYGRSLQALAAELGVAGRFAVLPPVGYDEVGRFTVGADAGHALYEPIHVNNRYITTASNKLMEYMAAGLPLLVSDRPGPRALVEKYGCGLVADESSPASIAAAVNTLLGNPALARQMGAAAAHAFATEFNYERQFAPVLAALRTLADPPAVQEAVL